MTQQTLTAKKTTAKKRTTTGKAATIKMTTENTTAGEISPDKRHNMIAEEAYLRAEQRGFVGDHEIDDWLQAEAEVDALFVEKH